MFLFCTESEVSRQARLDGNRAAQAFIRGTETPDARQTRLDANTS